MVRRAVDGERRVLPSPHTSIYNYCADTLLVLCFRTENPKCRTPSYHKSESRIRRHSVESLKPLLSAKLAKQTDLPRSCVFPSFLLCSVLHRVHSNKQENNATEDFRCQVSQVQACANRKRVPEYVEQDANGNS